MDGLALLCTLHADGPTTLKALRRAGFTDLRALAERPMEALASELGAELEIEPAAARRFVKEARALAARIGSELEPEDGLDGSFGMRSLALRAAVAPAPERGPLDRVDRALLERIVASAPQAAAAELAPAPRSGDATGDGATDAAFARAGIDLSVESPSAQTEPGFVSGADGVARVDAEARRARGGEPGAAIERAASIEPAGSIERDRAFDPGGSLASRAALESAPALESARAVGRGPSAFAALDGVDAELAQDLARAGIHSLDALVGADLLWLRRELGVTVAQVKRLVFLARRAMSATGDSPAAPTAGAGRGPSAAPKPAVKPLSAPIAPIAPIPAIAAPNARTAADSTAATPTARPTAMPAARPAASPIAPRIATPIGRPAASPIAPPAAPPNASPIAPPNAPSNASPDASSNASPNASPSAPSLAPRSGGERCSDARSNGPAVGDASRPATSVAHPERSASEGAPRAKFWEPRPFLADGAARAAEPEQGVVVDAAEVGRPRRFLDARSAPQAPLGPLATGGSAKLAPGPAATLAPAARATHATVAGATHSLAAGATQSPAAGAPLASHRPPGAAPASHARPSGGTTLGWDFEIPRPDADEELEGEPRIAGSSAPPQGPSHGPRTWRPLARDESSAGPFA